MEPQTFRTTITIKPSKEKFEIADSLFSIGSCFAEELNSLMRSGLLQAYSSPYGTVYNPQSIEMQIHRITHCEKACKSEIVSRDGAYVSMMAHGSIMATSPEELLETIDHHTHEANRRLREARFVIITLGTSYVYYYEPLETVVANCQKQNAKLFKRYRISVDEATASLQKIISDIKAINQKAQIILTVSPIRHLSDGMTENTLSKATLLLATANVTNGNDVQYFPSYEIVLDDLRDYRFYASDMAHPSAEAVRYVYNHFAETYFSEQVRNFAREAEKISASLRHRPMSQDKRMYAEYLEKTVQRVTNFAKQYSISKGYSPIEEVVLQLNNLKSDALAE